MNDENDDKTGDQTYDTADTISSIYLYDCPKVPAIPILMIVNGKSKITGDIKSKIISACTGIGCTSRSY
ncbi:unnamed protein product [Oppiella nova]|uniref:Uncharacterized protein n=1 Tax=Oppiella nova TaxID=334625 RepID=A0A7R9QN02_9ACAR|nr:unnamed protein product [Oppiella nova]CAG2169209.1 unnamed protein product [Oppiella nova]